MRLPDKNGKYDWYLEVNWKDDDPTTNESKVLKVTSPEGHESFIDREHFMSFLFAIGREEDQRDMMPQKISRVRWYETVLSVKATKDIRKGEAIVFPIKISLPAEEKEVIKRT